MIINQLETKYTGTPLLTRFFETMKFQQSYSWRIQDSSYTMQSTPQQMYSTCELGNKMSYVHNTLFCSSWDEFIMWTYNFIGIKIGTQKTFQVDCPSNKKNIQNICKKIETWVRNLQMMYCSVSCVIEFLHGWSKFRLCNFKFGHQNLLIFEIDGVMELRSSQNDILNFEI